MLVYRRRANTAGREIEVSIEISSVPKTAFEEANAIRWLAIAMRSAVGDWDDLASFSDKSSGLEKADEKS